MTTRTIWIGIGCLISLVIAPLAVPSTVAAASKPSFPKAFIGTLHSEADSVTPPADGLPEYHYHASLDVSSAIFQRTKKGRWPSKKWVDPSLRKRPFADFKLTAGTAAYAVTSTGGSACPTSFSAVYDATMSLLPRDNILRLTSLKKGRWGVVARVRSTRGPFSMIQTCAGLPDMSIEIGAYPMLLLTGDKISKSGELLKGTKTESQGGGSTQFWSWDLAASTS